MEGNGKKRFVMCKVKNVFNMFSIFSKLKPNARHRIMNITIVSALPPGKNTPGEEREEAVHRTRTSETQHKHQVNAKGNGTWGG